jgi:hypothetical protein
VIRPKQSTLCIPADDDPGGATPFERFDNIIKRVLSASKDDVERRMRAHRCAEGKKRKRRAPKSKPSKRSRSGR